MGHVFKCLALTAAICSAEVFIPSCQEAAQAQFCTHRIDALSGQCPGNLSVGDTACFDCAASGDCNTAQICIQSNGKCAVTISDPLTLACDGCPPRAHRLGGFTCSTPTPTGTSTETPTSTPTDTPTATPTSTPSSTHSVTPSPTPTSTPSATATDTPTPTSTPTSTSTQSPSSTPSPTQTATPSETPTPGPPAFGSTVWVGTVGQGTLTCSAGSVVDGFERTCTNDECQYGGSWNHRIRCRELLNVTFGSANWIGTIGNGTLTCPSGSVVDAFERTCTNDECQYGGSWNHRIRCRELLSVTVGASQWSASIGGGGGTLTCSAGAVMDAFERTCTNDECQYGGSWNHRIRCSAVGS